MAGSGTPAGRLPGRLRLLHGRVDHLAERAQRLRHALVRRGGYHHRGHLCGALEARLLVLQLFRRHRVGLVEGDDFRLVGKALTIGHEFLAYGLVGLASMLAGAVDEMQEYAATLDMAKE